MKKIAILASGEGTNAEAIARYFENSRDVKVAMMICNRKEAGVFARMRRFDIPTYYFPKAEWTELGAANVLRLLAEEGVDLVVLAGFLAMIPAEMVQAYGGRMINIHPSLIPKHCGKGMYGMKVHESVLAAKDTESGITIHQVSDVVDGGDIVFQARCEVLPDDTPDSLAGRVHGLEHRYFPEVVERVALGLD